MKPMHLAVIGAVLAVVVVCFLLLGDDGSGRGSQRSASDINRAPTPVTTDPENRDTEAGEEDASEGDLGVKFKVVDSEGEPALGVEVALVGARTRNVSTDESGAAGFDGLAAGFYDLRARKGNAVAALGFELTQTTDLGTLRLAESVAIRGHVYDPKGAPIPGARVEAVAYEVAAGFDFSKRIQRWLRPDAVAGTTKTNAQGAYELRVKKGASVALRVIASGFAQDGEPARAYHSDTDGVDFHLFGGTTVAGVVVDPDGRPIVAARVMFSDPMSIFMSNNAKTETSTALDGRFSMSVTPAQQSMITIRAAGYALHMDQLKMPATDMRITLEPGIMLRLRAMNEDDPVPAPGVNVFLTYKGGFANGTTDDRGELVIEHLPTKSGGAFGRQQQAFLVGGGYVAKTVSLADKEPVDGVLDVGDVKLKRGGTIRGRVLDDKTGNAVAGATVRTFGGLNMQIQMLGSVPTVSDKEGKFELTGVPPGATMLLAQHPDYTTELNPMALMGMGGGTGKTLFPDGKTEIEKDVTLTPAALVAGVVVDSGGSPVSGATVTEKVGDQQMMMRMFLGGGRPEAVSDAEGKFVLRGLKSGRSTKLVAAHREYGSSKPVTVNPGSGAAVSLTLAEPIQLHGVVEDERGDPIAGVRITASRKGSGRRNRFAPRLDLGAVRPAITDDKGEYVVRGAPPGELAIDFEHEGYQPGKHAVRTRAGEAIHEVGKTTLLRGPGIEGIVVDERGVPMARVAISANISWSRNAVPAPGSSNQGPGRQFANTVTDKEGRFALFGLRDAEYSVQPYQSGSYGESKTVRSGTTDVRLTLRPAAELKGRVTANGRPVVGATVRIEHPGKNDNTFTRGLGYAQTDAAGKFTVTPLPPDETFTVVIEHNGYATRRVENTTAGGGERSFLLDQGVRIGGIVVDNKGNPVPTARINVRAGTSNKSVRADADGRFVAGGLGDGEITIVIAGSSGFVKQASIPVTPGDMNVRVVVERGESIKGEVTGGKDEDLQGVRVEAIDESGEAVSTAWIWQGRRSFELRGLRPGTYALRVTRNAEGKWTTLREVAGVTAGSEGVEVAIE